MNQNIRIIKESPLYQGVDEQIAYTLTTTPWGSNPSSPVLVLKDSGGNDVTATYTTGSTTVSGDVITTKTVRNLIAGQIYRLEIKFTIGGSVLEAWAELHAQE
jgi:hypothetical protein